jgi:hypothetical protein
MRNFPVRIAIVLGTLLPCFASGTVTNCAEQELRAALVGGGTVAFQCDGVITLTNTIHITEPTVLDAQGVNVTISGGGSVRLFAVADGIAFSAKGIVLANGYHRGEDSIQTSETTATQPGDGMGGAIFSQGGIVNLIDCTLSNNVVIGGDALPRPSSAAPAFSGGDGMGGAIYALGGSISLSNCTVTTNRATGGMGNGGYSGNGDSGPGRGGAIYCHGVALQIKKSHFLKNQSSGGPGRSFFSADLFRAYSGHAEGGAICAAASSFTLTDSVFRSNQASGADGGSATSPLGIPFNAGPARGGGLFIVDGTTNAIIENCEFESNIASGGGGFRTSLGANGFGGAIAAASKVVILNSTFLANRSHGGSSFLPAPGHGGGVWSSQELVLSGSTFSANIAAGGHGGQQAVGSVGKEGAGGAVWASGKLLSTNCTFFANEAIGGQGYLFGGPLAPANGGAIALSSGEAVLQHLTLISNLSLRVTNLLVYGVPGTAGSLFVGTNASVTLGNSILAASSSHTNVHGSVIDAGYNLSSDSTPQFTSVGSRNGIDPMLGTLSDNGGPTMTIPLLANSPALDGVLGSSESPAFDQRGISRPHGPFPDIGAFEFSSLAPIMIQAPQGGIGLISTSFVFSAAAVGAQPLLYQWRKNQSPLQDQTNATLTLPVLQESDAGFYSVAVSNPFGQIRSPEAELIVDLKPWIAVPHKSLKVKLGEAARFSIEARGPSLSYEWRHEGLPIPGATNAEYIIPQTILSSAGYYSVTVTNFAGAAWATAPLTIDRTNLKIDVKPLSQTVEEGMSVTFTVKASGDDLPIRYQWYIDNWIGIPSATNSSFTIPVADLAHSGSYYVRVYDGFQEEWTKGAQLRVLPRGSLPRLVATQAGPSNISITFTQAPGADLRLLRSTNLVDWIPVQTSGTTNGTTVQILESTSKENRSFFKIAP